jgi:uncharacterized membrane protein YdcZ (DUF606 family)
LEVPLTGAALIPVLVAALVGLCVVVQGSVNAIVGREVSLWLVVVANNLLAASLALGLWLFQRGAAVGALRVELGRLSPLVALSAVCGLIIVSGVPFAIRSLGVSRTLPLVIGAQLVGALLWDLRAGQPPSLQRVGGVVLVLLGALLAVRG